MIDYSIVVPVYKSVASLEKIIEGVQEIMLEIDHSFELIFVEDHGSMESWNELVRLKKKCPEFIRVFRLSRNFGQNAATICGIDHANGKDVITIDDDLQIPLAEIKKLIDYKKLRDSDIVYGRFVDTNNSGIRRLGRYLVNLMLNGRSNTIGSSFRIIDSNLVNQIKNHSQDHLFINQVISWYTSDFAYVDVERSKREEGRSGYSLFKLIGITFKLIFYYTSIPLKIMIGLCLIVAIICFGMAGYYIFRKVSLDNEIEVLTITLFSAVSLILASVSMIGVYVNRIYSARVKRPNYSIKIEL
ncbi:MAG: glycosyltransferase involved in cell wall biosynthesis [Arenicella sp.]|jgi:glycosyltransferase involved in cell wall biosynthesis